MAGQQKATAAESNGGEGVSTSTQAQQKVAATGGHCCLPLSWVLPCAGQAPMPAAAAALPLRSAPPSSCTAGRTRCRCSSQVTATLCCRSRCCPTHVARRCCSRSAAAALHLPTALKSRMAWPAPPVALRPTATACCTTPHYQQLLDTQAHRTRCQSRSRS